MNRTPVFEDDLTEWLEEGPTDAPDRVLDTVLAAFPSIPQRRAAPRVPWRLPPMNGYARVLAGIAAVAVVAFGGLIFALGSSSNPVGRPSSAVQSTAATSPAASPSPSVSPPASATTGSVDTSTWIAFTSARHGITVRYPAGWKATRSTAPWPAGTYVTDQPIPMLDTFLSPDGQTIVVASQPLPAGLTGEAWLAGRQNAAAAQSPSEAQCWPAPADFEQGTVGGQPAWLHTGCWMNEAIAVVGGRVYDILGYPDPFYNYPLFAAFLSTVSFDPAKADDTAVAPIDTTTWTTYVSSRFGFSIGHPADWSEHPADHDWTFAVDAGDTSSPGAFTAWETFLAPDSSIAISAWSVAVEPGTTAGSWLQAYCPIAEKPFPCATIQDRAVAVTVDGHAGSIVPFTEDVQAFVLVNDRMYVVASWRPADMYDSLRLLQAYLSTMHLLPGGPAPASATPRPS